MHSSVYERVNSIHVATIITSSKPVPDWTEYRCSVTLLEQRRRERLVSTRTLFPPGVSLSENYVAKFLVARRAGNTSRYSRLHSNRDSGRCMHIWWNNTNAAPGFHRDDFAPDTTLHHTKHIHAILAASSSGFSCCRICVLLIVPPNI